MLRDADRWTGIALALAGAGLLMATFEIRLSEPGLVGPRLVPQIIASLIAAGGLALALGGKGQDGKVDPIRPWRAGFLIVIGFAYVGLVPRVGYAMATILTTGAALALFGQRNGPVLVGVSLASGLMFHLLFIELMGVFMPAGRWFDLADMVG